ncbi:MAG: hypothetical protein MUC66_09660 [Methanolinea sp.]|jgi:predicted  nucleic acid-binding Zn-ribbon protein|nr:hypothetical protein [Methanolinea sp.]
MFRRVKELFGGKEAPAVQEIRLDEIPGLLSDYEKEWGEEARLATSASRQKIMETRDHLLIAIQQLSGSDRAAAFHPKLEKITQNSLPQFQKALLTALNRDLPEDADAFYQACAESLKGCVKGLAGPGRYLRNVFPEEMKEIRVMIDEFGTEINALTQMVAEWRKKREIGTLLCEAYTQSRDMKIALENLSREIPVIRAEIADLDRTIEESRNEKEKCARQLAEDHDLLDAVKEAARLEDALRETERELHAVLSTLTHVLRKGEKITHRADAERLARQLKQVIVHVTEKEIPPGEEVVREVASVLPVISTMIGSGEIQLKNQEERTLFSTPDHIPGTLSRLIGEREQARKEAGKMKDLLAAHPVKVRLVKVEDDLKHIQAEQREKDMRVKDLEQKRKDLEAGLPGRYRQMEAHLSVILGRKIRISGD